jgi:competence protein ComEC
LKKRIQKEELVFVRLLLPLVLGIACAIALPPATMDSEVALSIAFVLFLIFWFCVIFYNEFKLYLHRRKIGMLAQFFIFFIGIALTLERNQQQSHTHFSRFDNEALVVAIKSEPKLNGDILRFECEVKQGLDNKQFIPQSGNLLIALKLEDRTHQYRYGDELLIQNLCKEVEPPYNPYEFDYKSFLANRGIYHQAFIKESQIAVFPEHHSNFVIEQALAFRKKLVKKFDKYIPNKEAASVASTLILGYKAELSPQVLSAYSKTGTMHVLSVSGMHVGIVFIILGRLLWFMDRNKTLRVLRAVLIISIILFYALVTGFSPSVCRAALMLSFYVLGKAVYRNSNSYNLVAISAVFLLLYNPYFLLDVGCQLSYLAVLGLIYFYPKIYHLFYVKNWLGDQVWSYVALSCAAQLATFPLAMYYFHQFPVYFLISNLFIVIPVVVIMYLGLLFLFIPWPVLLKFMGIGLEWGISFMNKGLFTIERLPFASFSSYQNINCYIAIYLIMAGLAMAIQFHSKRVLYLSFLMLLLLVSTQSFTSVATGNKKHITFYTLRKNVAFGFFHGSDAWLYSDLDSGDKTLSYSIKAAVEASATDFKFLSLKQKILDSSLYSDKNFFMFNGWKMLVWDKEFDRKLPFKRVKVDVLLLSGRPKVVLKDVQKVVKFNELLIDATNPDYLIKRWSAEATALSLNYRVLKKSQAYTITLN